MTTLPTGETLPEYDDGPADGVDTRKLLDWLHEQRGWGYGPHTCMPETHIRDVLAALQATGDATLLKNGTYRLLRRDARDVERLAARLTKAGHTALIVECDGSPVDAALAILDALDITAPPPAVTG